MTDQPSDDLVDGPPVTHSPRRGRRTGASTYRTGLVIGAAMALLGIALALAIETVASPLVTVLGWLVIAWSTHRMGRSGPLLDWPSSSQRDGRTRRKQ